MIKRAITLARLYFAQSWLSYHGRFAITHPFGYITSKIGFPFFLMVFFIFLGKFVGFADPLYIVIGHILLIPSNNGMCGVTLAIGDERQWGTLSYVLGSPAPRAPVFIGRATYYILDGFVTALIGFGIAAGIFHMDLGQVNFGLLAGCVLLISATSTGLGFLFGSIALVSRDGWTISEHLPAGDLHPGGRQLPDHSAAGISAKGCLRPAPDARCAGGTGDPGRRGLERDQRADGGRSAGGGSLHPDRLLCISADREAQHHPGDAGRDLKKSLRNSLQKPDTIF